MRKFIEKTIPDRHLIKWTFVLIAVMLALVYMMIRPLVVHADAPPPDNLWQGLLAEAVDQGWDGMYAVACVVRNRLAEGKGHGLCGLKRRNLEAFCKREGHMAEVVAKGIVDQVFNKGGKDTTGGATHYESDRYPIPYWAKNMQKTVKIGQHQFYKER